MPRVQYFRNFSSDRKTTRSPPDHPIISAPAGRGLAGSAALEMELQGGGSYSGIVGGVLAPDIVQRICATAISDVRKRTST